MCHKGETIFCSLPFGSKSAAGIFFQEAVLCVLDKPDGIKIHIYRFLI